MSTPGPADRSRLREAAIEVLRRNDRGGTTIPSATLYPHQWNWDSAFASMGWAHVDPARGLTELERLVAGAWPDGMVPHIIFNPEATGYEPGPRWWGTEGRAGSDRRTSSITQPPVAATALRYLLDRAADSALAERARGVVTALERWHRWFYEARDPRGESLPAIIHPWESGMDNSPRWDEPLSRVPRCESLGFERADTAHVAADARPQKVDYLRFAYLVQLNTERGFAPPRPESWPFLVQDVVLLAILLQAERDLQAVADGLGVAEVRAGERALRLERAVMERLWDQASGCFLDRDLVSGRLLPPTSVAAHLPIYAGLGGRAAAERAAQALEPSGELDAPFGVPTVSLSSPLFERRRYWRGPTWINVNWMLHEGLRRAGLEESAARLREQTLTLVDRSGFWEYFDPVSGEGIGGAEFTWSAALVLDLLSGAA